MPTYRLQTSLFDRSGLPRDEYVSSVHVAFPATATTIQLDNCLGAMQNFYTAIASYLSPTIRYADHTSKAYLLGAPLKSPPVDSRTWTFGVAPGGQALPNEVASCLSFHGSVQPGVAAQSWRGRIFIGPLNTSCVATGGTNSNMNVAFRTAVLDAAADMAALLNADGKWVIASKKLHEVFPVANFSMDDAWDTQRSRGLRPNTREARAIPGGGGSAGPW